MWVIPKLVRLIPSAGNHLAGALISDGKGEDGETEQEDDEDEHDEKVEPEEPGHAAARADEACEWDHHEEDAEGDDWALEELFAFCGGLAGEPDSGAEDWDGEEEGYEV